MRASVQICFKAILVDSHSNEHAVKLRTREDALYNTTDALQGSLFGQQASGAEAQLEFVKAACVACFR